MIIPFRKVIPRRAPEPASDLVEELRRSLTTAALALRCVEIGAAHADLVAHAASEYEKSLLSLRAHAVRSR